MKKLYPILTALLLCFLGVFCACSKKQEEKDTPQPVYLVVALQSELTVHEDELDGYDFVKLFKATKDGEAVSVEASWVDTSQLAEGNDGVVTCTYETASASIRVHVQRAVYAVTLAQNEVTVYPSRAATYDYLSLFSATRDGKSYPITSDMAKGSVSSALGDYTYTVTVCGASATLTVHVVEGHYLEIISCYPVYSTTLDALQELDATSLFMLYVDDCIAPITEDMIDKSALDGAVEGGEYEIFLTAEAAPSSLTKSCKVKVVAPLQTTVTPHNVVTYPNSAIIDLTTLFDVKAGSESVEITSDMISGTVDYNNAGTYPVTLTYGGEEYTATVEIKSGVVIRHRNGEVVEIQKGTDQSLYDFGADFEVIINGVVFDNVNDLVNSSDVDFSSAGEYTATIEVKYNTKALSTGAPNFDTETASITYRVVENKYSLQVQEELVLLSPATQKYNVFGNLVMFVNGVRSYFTQILEYAQFNTYYAQIVKDIDYTSSGEQEIVIDVYPNGIEASPVRVGYRLIIASDISVEAVNKSVFTGANLYTRDLFTIRENGVNVPVTEEYVYGNVNVFRAGRYFITCNYKGIERTAQVIVYDREMLGTYTTRLRTLYVDTGSVVKDDEEDFISRRFGNLVFDGETLTINSSVCEILDPIDEASLKISYERNVYTLYYFDGIIVLEPENSLRMQYTNVKRPLVYFNESVWDNDSVLSVNFSSQGTHVLSTTSSSVYTLDAFHLISQEDGSERWYGLYIRLISHMSSDWYYEVKWGEAVFENGFEQKIGVSSYVDFEGERYAFTVKTDDRFTAIIEREGETRKYVNVTFKGTVDGVSSTLAFDAYEHATLRINNEVVFSALTTTEYSTMKNGGFDYDNDVVFLYLFNPETGKQIYSYRFELNPSAKTFTLAARDKYFGKYVYRNKFIFLDGYGTGHICFDSASPYINTLFDYTVTGNEVTLTYRDTLSTFAYGSGATFYIAPLGNVLTIKSFKDGSVPDDASFVNTFITNGAVIRYELSTIGTVSEVVAKELIYSSIQVITAEGTLSGNSLKDSETVSVNMSRVKFGTEGFYRIRITVPYNSGSVTVDYALQIVADHYSDSPAVGSFGGGVLNESNRITIQANGLATVVTGGVSYQGYTIFAENKFAIIAKDANGNAIRAEGEVLEEGLLIVRCSGAAAFSDYFTTGSVKVAGGEKVLRVITLAEKTVYIFAGSSGALGEIVSVESVSGGMEDGCVLCVDGETFVKVVSWGNSSSGLLVNDGYRGTYRSASGAGELILDGFGGLTLDGASGTYLLHSGNRITVIVGNTVAVYHLTMKAGEYEKLDYPLDNSLLQGKEMQAITTYTADESSYTATTTFSFGKDGKVTVTSTSSYSGYAPLFAGEGSYTVSGNRATVTVNGYTVVFTIPDVIDVNAIVCASTTVPASSEGYFAKDVKFTLYEREESGDSGNSGNSGYDDWGEGGDWDD